MRPAVTPADLADPDLSPRASTAQPEICLPQTASIPIEARAAVPTSIPEAHPVWPRQQELSPAPRTSSLAQHGKLLQRLGTPLPFLVIERRWEPVSGHVCQLPGAGGHFLKASPSGRQPALPCASGSWQLAHLVFRYHRVGLKAHLTPLPSGSHPQRAGRASCLNVFTLGALTALYL